MTQERLGELAGLSYKFIGEVERGIANPTIDSLARIADALGTEIGDLLGNPLPIGVGRLTQHDYSMVREARDSLDEIVRRFRGSKKR